ncbi:TonB family protein [Anatilimnocola sp. NA78]|uniref:energy transducer TonB n=1 Tax=Anatilimnocola sp. NA78 TaxID=3415683 RepID=UPI003CE4DD1C
MNFRSIARHCLRPLPVGLGVTTLIHSASAAVVVYLLLAFPHIFVIQIRRGEAVVLQAQMAAVAATQPEQTQEIEVSVEAIPLQPPPQVAVEHAPIRDTLEPTPAAIPVVRQGEYEPTDVQPQDKPPETSVSLDSPAKLPAKEPTKEAPPEQQVAASKPLDRQVSDKLVISPSKVNTLAAQLTEAGAKVDELPRKLPNNREPYYPRDELISGIEGKVMLRVQISAAGRVLAASVQTSSGYTSFDESALEAVRQWKFAPAKRQGLAVTHDVFVPVRFLIRRG